MVSVVAAVPCTAMSASGSGQTGSMLGATVRPGSLECGPLWHCHLYVWAPVALPPTHAHLCILAFPCPAVGTAAIATFGYKGAKDAKLPITVGPQTSGARMMHGAGGWGSRGGS